MSAAPAAAECMLTPAQPRDAAWMQRALELAHAARSMAEVPVGAIVVHDGRILAEAWNRTRSDNDPTAHAELVALRLAARAVGSVRLPETEMYVTLEPCAMCAGALVLARIERLIYAAADPKSGMCGSLACIVQDSRLNHRMQVTAGVLAEPAGDLLRDFFRERRDRATPP